MRFGIMSICLIASLVTTAFPVFAEEKTTDQTQSRKIVISPRAQRAVEKQDAVKPGVTKDVRTGVAATAAQQPLGVVSITSPKAGDRFLHGDEVVIEWSKQGYVPDKCYRISLVKGSQEVTEIKNRVCVNGFRWKVPETEVGPGYAVKVTTTDNRVSAESAPFAITAAQTDLTIGQLTVTPTQLQAGEMVTMKMRVDNAGATKSQERKAYFIIGRVTATWANATKVEFTVPPLAFGDHRYYTHEVKFPGGDFVVWALVGRFWVPSAGDENAPDAKSVRVRVSGPNNPDLVACIFHPSKTKPGIDFPITVTVQNKGKQTAGSSKLRTWVDGMGAVETEVPPLRPEEYVRLIGRAVTFDTEGETNFRAEVNADNSVTESDTTNNKITGKIIHSPTYEPEGMFPTVCSDGRRS